MKTPFLALALLGATFFPAGAFAEETIVHEHTTTTPGPGVTVGVPGVGVHVGAPGHVEHKTTTETVGSDSDCRTKTVHREDDAGSTTVRKERCD
jgi:hypothetical protein